MGKKIGVLLVLLVLGMLIVNVGFVSADLSDGIGKVFESVRGILQALWNQLISPIITSLFNTGDPTEVVPRFLFFIIVLGMVHFALKGVPFFQNQNRFLYGAIVFGVAFLSVRYLSGTNLIETILFPYSVFGIVITSGIPFLMMFLILNIGFSGSQYKLLRKIGWIFFGVILIYMWFTRGGVILPSATFPPAGVIPASWLPYLTGAVINPVSSELANFSWIYLITGLLAIAMAILDKRIQIAKEKIKEEKIKDIQKSKIISEIDSQIAEMENRIALGVGNEDQVKRVINSLIERKNYFSKNK